MQTFLPKAFNKYFWDTNTTELSPGKNKTYMIERLLELGDLEELEWVNKNFSKQEVKKTIQDSRRITPKTGNFFSIYYGIPKGSLACMKKPSI